MKVIQYIYLLPLFICSCVNTDEHNNAKSHSTIKSRIDSALTQDSIEIAKVILTQVKGEGKSIPKGVAVNLEGIPSFEKTSIKVQDHYFTKANITKNPKNSLLNDELYLVITVEYKFYIDKIKEYRSQDDLSSAFHTNKWYVVDNTGTYYPVLLSFQEDANKERHTFFDGITNSPAFLPSKVKDRSSVNEELPFKMPENATPQKLIYINRSFIDNSFISMDFIL